MMEDIFEQALNLESPWYIKSTNFDYENKRLDIEIDFERGAKFEYVNTEGEIKEGSVYDTKNKSWRHLNFFQHECYLNARIPRIIKEDNKVEMIVPPWDGEMKGFTLLFEAMLLQLCTAMPVLKVSQMSGVSDDKIWLMLERYVDQAVSNIDLSELCLLGLDETSQVKRHNYITLFVDLQKRKIVYITEGKDSSTVKKFVSFLEEQGGDPDKITDVSSDMSRAFIKGVNENLPNAEITFDKFHIMKIISEAVDKVRREESKEQSILKGNRYLFLKNDYKLTENQKKTLESLKMSKLNLKSIRALHIRENFQEIYQSASSEEFEVKLNKWYFWATHSQLEPIKECAYTIKRHWSGILRWWKSKLNNGILEGLNSIIQAAKSKARGYKLSKNYKIIAYLLAGDIDLHSLNIHYPKLGLN